MLEYFLLLHWAVCDGVQWLAKQAAARQAVQDAKRAGDDAIEHDPLWYKDRGKYVLPRRTSAAGCCGCGCVTCCSEYFKADNYLGAINAFTAGCTIAGLIVALC